MVRTPEELQAELRRVGRVATGIQSRYAAHMALHKAACLNWDRVEMQQQRDNLHTLLDALLDNGETLQLLLDEVGYTG